MNSREMIKAIPICESFSFMLHLRIVLTMVRAFGEENRPCDGSNQ